MARILKRPQAETDLDEIWWYIAQDNPDNAYEDDDRRGINAEHVEKVRRIPAQ